MDRRALALAAGAVAAGGAVLLRRGLRDLDAADAEHVLEPSSFTFPPGRRVDVTTTDGATIATETTGTGPTVVLVHGITSSRHDWGPVARLLIERGRTVVGVDQRGHGDSTSGSEGYRPTRLGQDLAEVLAHLDLRRVVIAGHSMGGIAAMSCALDHPRVIAERAESLVLVATTPRTPGLFRRPRPFLVGAVLGQARYDPAVRRPALAQLLFGRFGSRRLVDAARASALRADPHQVAECAAALAGYDITDRLAAIETPTSCVYGTRDVVTSPAANRLIATALPNATAEEVDGAGHLVIWTHPGEIADRITDGHDR